MCKKLIYLFLAFGFCLAAAQGNLTMVPLPAWNITGDYGDILSLNGIPASNLITGTSTFTNPPGSSPDEPASGADDFSLYTAACADSQAWMKTIFGQPVTTIFILEKSGNDSGTIQGLAADGSTLVGNAFSFTGGSSYWTSTGYLASYGHGQTAYGTVITSDVPIYGILITAPGIDPISISAVRPFFNFLDFANFAAQWLRADCGPSNTWCSGADLGYDGSVLLDDLEELVYYWLGCGLPHSFSLSSPANGATGVVTNPNLIWTASLGAASYTLVVDDNNDYSSPVFNQDVGNVISKVVLGLANSTTYYWKVTAHNSAGDTAASNNSFSFTTAAPDVWVLTFSDEFDYTGAPDPAKWDRPEYNRRNNSSGPDGWWEQDDSYCENGHLVIRVRRVANRNSDGDPYDYNVGAIRTYGKFTQTYGKYEIRAQMPTEQGWWVAFWMMQGNPSSVGNGGVDGSEVDIFEGWGWTDKIQHAIHWDGYGSAHESVGHSEYISSIRSGWHTFTLIWDPDMYYFYVDDVEQWHTTGGGVCNQPGYVKITGEVSTESWAITDSWSRNPADATYPDYFLVDYCRVYQKQ